MSADLIQIVFLSVVAIVITRYLWI